MRNQARNLRRNMTEAEQALWRELRRNCLGWRFRRQFPIPPYIVDFACPEAGLVVEADGGQHSRTGEHDRRDAILRRKGWRVLRFWNNEILRNRFGVLRTIAEALGPWPSICPHPNPPPQTGEGVASASKEIPLLLAEARGIASTRMAVSPPPLAGEGELVES